MNRSAVTDFPVLRARRTLLASLVIVGMGFSVLFPLLAPLGRAIGLSELQITTIISASGMVVFLATPRWGRLSDRWGRKRVMLIGLIGFALGTALFNSVLYIGLVGWLTGTALFIALIAARMTHAAMMAASMPAANALMADLTTRAERTKGMGQAAAANNLGAILGPAFATLAAISLLAPLWAMAALAAVNALFVLLFLPDPPRAVPAGKPPARMKYTDRRILPFIVIGVLMFTGMAVVQQTMGFRFQDVLGLDAAGTARQFGFAMMLSAGCSLLAQGVFVQRMSLPPFRLLLLAMPLLIVAFVIMATVQSQLLLTIALMIQGFGMGLAGPAFMAGASLAVSAEEQGAVAGVAGSCGPLGFTLGPMLGGLLYQAGPTLPYATSAVVYCFLLVFTIWVSRRIRREKKAPAPSEGSVQD